MCRIISFISARGGLGKTSLISMLGKELANMGKKVCLLDGMFAFNDLYTKFENNRQFDLCEYLVGNIGIYDVLSIAGQNLYFIKSNDPRFDYLRHAELICKLTGDLAAQFDFILIEVNAKDKKNLNLFLSLSSEVFLIVSQEREVLLNSIKLLHKIDYYKNITNIKLVINKFKVISNLKGTAMSEEEIASILKKEILFSFPLFLKYNIFSFQESEKYFYYSKCFAKSVEKNIWLRVDYKKQFRGLFGKVKRLVYYKFE